MTTRMRLRRTVTVLATTSLLPILTTLSSIEPAAAAATFPVTIHATNGTIIIKHRPTAIVSLSPSATEMLFAIGAGAQVKAVDENSDYPKNAPMTKLNGNSPNIEAIAAYKPDLVVVAEDSASFETQMHSLGIAVVELPAVSNLGGEYQQFLTLGRATGHLEQANAQVLSLKRSIRAIVASIGAGHRTRTYYYELDSTYYSETSATFIGQLLGLLGLHSIADAAATAVSSGGYPQLSEEFILKANPNYIFLADTVCCGQSAKTVASRPGWRTLTAVSDSRVLGLNDDIASRWGPRVVDLLQAVANELRRHPVG